MDQSLTSLRKESPPTVAEQLSPQSKDKIKLATLKADITLLTKKKETIEGNIEELVNTEEKTKVRIKGDVAGLIKRKGILLEQVDELLETFGVLKDGRKKIITAFEKFGQERVDVLSSVSKALRLDIKDELSNLSEKSSSLSKTEQFLLEFAAFYIKYAEIVEAETAQNQQRGAELSKEATNLSDLKKIVDKMQKDWKEKLSKADSKLEEAKQKCQNAVEGTEYIEKEADRERFRLKSWAKTIELREKTVKAEKGRVKEFEKELDTREGWLDDREETLGRTIKRLGLEDLL